MPKEQTITRTCPHHGLTKFAITTKGTKRCKDCRSKAVSDFRRKSKRRLVDTFGGKCMACGYSRCVEALDFHHVDPSKKKFALGSGYTWAFDKLLEEAKKCVLVCSYCHAEIEYGFRECPPLLFQS